MQLASHFSEEDLSTGQARPDAWLSFGFAFVGGYGDASGFVLAKTFTGHVTGTMVLGAISLAAGDWRNLFGHLSAIVTFLAGVFLSALAMRPQKVWRSSLALSTVMAAEVILILAASLALASHATSGVEYFVIFVSLALGLQNGAFRRTGGFSVHTTYLTGLITGLIATKAESYSLSVDPASPAAPDPKRNFLVRIWITFVLGAVIGAVMTLHFRELGILGAALVLSTLIVRNAQPESLAEES